MYYKCIYIRCLAKHKLSSVKECVDSYHDSPCMIVLILVIIVMGMAMMMNLQSLYPASCISQCIIVHPKITVSVIKAGIVVYFKYELWNG